MKSGTKNQPPMIRIPKLSVSSKCMGGQHASCFSKGCICGCHGGNPKEKAA